MTRLLGIASLIDHPFEASFLVELGDGSTGSITVLSTRQSAAGLFHGSTACIVYDFVHELSRHAFHGVDRRARTSGAASSDCGCDGTRKCRPLGSLRTGAERRRRRMARTLEWAGAAGEDAMRLSDPGGACHWFELAVEASDDAQTQARFLIRLADAQWQSGEGSHMIRSPRHYESRRELTIRSCSSKPPPSGRRCGHRCLRSNARHGSRCRARPPRRRATTEYAASFSPAFRRSS